MKRKPQHEFAFEVQARMEAEGIAQVYNADQAAVAFKCLHRKTINSTG